MVPRPRALDYVFALEIMDRRLARQVWRDGIKACWDNRCAYCNGTPVDDRSLTLDHVRARSQGGEDLTSNLVPACAPCNSQKGSEDWRGWFREQPFYCPTREEEISAWMRTGDRHAGTWWDVGVGDLEAYAETLRAQPAAA